MIKRIVGDSACDLRSMDDVEFRCVPLTISTAEKNFLDDDGLKLEEMLDYLASYRGRSYTACPSPEKWESAYEGADEVFVITLSSNLSGSYNTAMVAADTYMESHPEAKVHVFDSLSAGPEEKMLAEKLRDWILAGLSFDEIVANGKEFLSHSRIFFALESFHNFAENGRVSKVVAAAAGVLGIRILATGNDKGTIEIIDKCRGDKRLMNAFLNRMKEAGFTGGMVRIGHCFNPGFAETLKEAILKTWETAEIAVYQLNGLCSFYAEKGGTLVACECAPAYK